MVERVKVIYRDDDVSIREMDVVDIVIWKKERKKERKKDAWEFLFTYMFVSSSGISFHLHIPECEIVNDK